MEEKIKQPTVKIENKIEKRLKNLKRFGKEKPPARPSSESKRKGWERRREAQSIMDMVMKQGGMTVASFKELLKDISAHPDRYTVAEQKIAQYVAQEKYLVDWLDRHISKAPIEVSGPDGGRIVINVNTNSEIKKKG